MNGVTESEAKAALEAIASMMDRTRRAETKFAQGTSQHTLQRNRLQALHIAAALLEKSLGTGAAVDVYAQEDLQKALAPITSLISKSEKAQAKLTQGTWQHRMLDNNLKALRLALPLLEAALDGGTPEAG